MTTSASFRKRLLFVALGVLIVVLVIEVVAFLAFLVVDGQPFSLARLAGERTRLAGRAPASGAEVAGQGVEQHLAAQVVHPYLGFVTDPDAEATHEILAMYKRGFSEQGFFQPVWTEGLEVDENALRVGIFGGSVATLFAMQSRFLVEAMQEYGAFSDRQIVVRCFATPGYKQPQQLLTLAYLLAQHEDLDVVVNLDGFNEITLPVAKNLPDGVHPLYPMDWLLRVRDVPEPAHRRRVGELAYLRAERRRRALGFADLPLRFSPTANLLWRLGDRRLAARAATVLAELEADPGVAGGFLSHGPRWVARGPEETSRYLVGIWRESSLQMSHLCAGADIRYLHALQPNQYVPGSKPMGREERRRAFDNEHPYREIVAEGYPRLVAAGVELQQAGVDFLDLSLAFSKVDEPLYIDTCCHFGFAGNRLLAERIAEALAATGREQQPRATPALSPSPR